MFHKGIATDTSVEDEEVADSGGSRKQSPLKTRINIMKVFLRTPPTSYCAFVDNCWSWDICYTKVCFLPRPTQL